MDKIWGAEEQSAVLSINLSLSSFYLICFLCLLFYNFTQTDWVSIWDYFSQQRNQCKVAKAMREPIDSCKHKPKRWCQLLVSFHFPHFANCAPHLHHGWPRGYPVICKRTQWRPTVVCDCVSLQNKQANNNKRKESKKKEERDSYFHHTSLDYVFTLNKPDGQEILL